jgi:hypothetical protein
MIRGIVTLVTMMINIRNEDYRPGYLYLARSDRHRKLQYLQLFSETLQLSKAVMFLGLPGRGCEMI